MKTGSLYIDGSDAYLCYGVYVVEGGWKSLVCLPPIKDVTINDWQEEDGIEVDLESPVLNTRDVEIQFAFTGEYSDFVMFIDNLSNDAYHTFDCAEIGRTFKLRMTQQPNMSGAAGLKVFTVKFADDFPLDEYSYQPPVSQVESTGDYLIDGKPFTDYGVRILEGTLNEIIKGAAIKQNLLRNIKTLPGSQYDEYMVRFKSKDVKLHCLLRAESKAELWRNYDALLYDIIRPQERKLSVKAIGKEFPFYYKSASVEAFYPNDEKVWLEFSLSIVFTDDFRINDDDVVLASE